MQVIVNTVNTEHRPEEDMKKQHGEAWRVSESVGVCRCDLAEILSMIPSHSTHGDLGQSMWGEGRECFWYWRSGTLAPWLQEGAESDGAMDAQKCGVLNRNNLDRANRASTCKATHNTQNNNGTIAQEFNPSILCSLHPCDLSTCPSRRDGTHVPHNDMSS